jgi:23S rRNA (pseudouridine1915-N3)-methyltransferase
MPSWINSGFEEYARRLPKDYQLNLIEIPALKRGKNADIKRLIEQESEKLLDAVPKDSLKIVLDEHGKQWDTLELAKQLQNWHDIPQNISLLIGGPDGVSAACLRQANLTWSLAKLTLPHPLVRVIIAEQIYRAWSIIARHPYHRN